MTRELIVDALNRCEPYVIPECCGGCPYEGCWGTKEECITQLHADTYALLKAQGPRVMTLEEVGKWVLIKRVDREPIFIEVKDSISAWIVSDEYWDIPLNVNLCSEFYGIIWRCWTSRPDEKVRAETPWE